MGAAVFAALLLQPKRRTVSEETSTADRYNDAFFITILRVGQMRFVALTATPLYRIENPKNGKGLRSEVRITKSGVSAMVFPRYHSGYGPLPEQVEAFPPRQA
jgi:hypothetical protein